MITKKEALNIAVKAAPYGLVSKDGYTNIHDIGDNNGYYGFDDILEPDAEFSESMLCVSKENGDVAWISGGYLFTNYDMTKVIKEPM